MAVAYGTSGQPGLLPQQDAPPLLPKPGKDNVRLQKLLKRTAKKKAAAQASQSTTPFRSSLSPVNEASPDLERSDHSTPPYTPETPSGLYSIQQPPRFTVRPLYQHVASPYPQRAAYGRAARMSPPTTVIHSYSYSHTTVNRHSGVSTFMGQVSQNKASSAVPEITPQGTQLKTPEVSTLAESRAGLRSATAKPKSLGPTPYPEPVGQAVVRPLTVLNPLIKSKSPRPTFKATEPSRSPKPMFDVPQIRMYTASTSYYETSKTPPVYDSSGLTAIGVTLAQSKTSAETKQDLIQAPQARGSIATTQPPSLVTDSQRKTPTPESKRCTTPTAKMASETRRDTSPVAMKRAPQSQTRRATPTETNRATPTSEVTSTPHAAETTSVTPTPEPPLPRTVLGRPKTPAYHVMRATTPVFEISRPNPLLFAVPPITAEPEKPGTPKTMSSVSSSPAFQTLGVTELPAMLPNGDIHADIPPADKEIQEPAVTKSEADLTRGRTQAAPAASKRPATPTFGPPTPAVSGYHRPRTPTYEASRLMTISPGYKRPKTPTHSVSSEVSLPMTGVSQKSKSAYCGLTPAEYVAYGGIKTHSPAFGISSSIALTHEDAQPEQKVPEEPHVKAGSTAKGSTVAEASEDGTHQGRVEIGGKSSVPTIVVSQASESLSSKLIQESSASEGTNSEKKIRETQLQELKTPETKGSPPKDNNQDPLKAVKRLLGKDKVQITEKTGDASLLQDPPKPVSAATVKPEGSKPSLAAPAALAKVLTAEPGTADQGKDKETETAPAEKKEGDKTAAEPLLRVKQKSKDVKSKLSGWSRLKKHMVVEQEEPTFPEPGSQKEVTGQNQEEEKMPEKHLEEKPGGQSETDTKDTPKATKMWNAVLFQMFSSKESIMHQIELNKSEKEMEKETEETANELKEIPSFAYRLPVLLFSPKFDAKKLKEAAARPATKISTVFEMGLIGRKGKDEEPKDFNRTARGFAAT